eukprot:5848887-Pyramimonas_sp.AAC.2
MASCACAHVWLVLGQPIHVQAPQHRILPARLRGACCTDCVISPAASLFPAGPLPGAGLLARLSRREASALGAPEILPIVSIGSPSTDRAL